MVENLPQKLKKVVYYLCLFFFLVVWYVVNGCFCFVLVSFAWRELTIVMRNYFFRDILTTEDILNNVQLVMHFP